MLKIQPQGTKRRLDHLAPLALVLAELYPTTNAVFEWGWGGSLLGPSGTVLVPALMHLSGRANWWLPGWLDKILPQLSVEPAEPPAAVRPPAVIADAARR